VLLVKNTSDEAIEYFLIASYSCLISVVVRLEYLREKGQCAVLFCLTRPLYQFLKQLSEHYDWIEVYYVDVTDLTTCSLRNPVHWWQMRRNLQVLYETWFAKIPNGQAVHFYNRYAALFLFYVIWHLKDDHIIHYVASDPAGVHSESHRIFSQIQKLIFQLIYSVPLKMVDAAGRKTNTFPALTDHALAEIIDEEHPGTYTVADIQTSELFQVLSWHSEAQVLWVMGLVLDMDEVLPSAYNDVLQQCRDLVGSVFAPSQQVVKFHPRAQTRETGWLPDVRYISGHIPAEFIKLPELKMVLTISSTAVSMLGASSNVKIISLVELIPFRDETTRDAHRRLARHFGSEIAFFMPVSMVEFKDYLRDSQ
jgi:hypothetical protein